MRAGDLVPQAPEVASAEVRCASPLLAYELPDGRLKLIDRLLTSLDPDQEVTVEVLAVTEEEARVLVLTFDPLVALVEYDDAVLIELLASDSEVLADFWSRDTEPNHRDEQELQDALAEGSASSTKPPARPWLLLIECADEVAQQALLARFQSEGLRCQPLLS
jgi:hypothetical protein